MFITLIHWVLLFLVVIPIATLIHEMGHGMAIMFYTKNGVAKIFLGEGNETTNKERFRIGRMRFHMQWSLIGFCRVVSNKEEFTKRKQIMFFLFGPLFSLLLSAVFFIMLQWTQSMEFIHTLFRSIVIFNLLQFLLTILPIKYPSWFGGYGGMSSDGYKIMQIAKNNVYDRDSG